MKTNATLPSQCTSCQLEKAGHLVIPMKGAPRNSSRNGGTDRKRDEFIRFTVNSEKISTDVPDSFSGDARCFVFRSDPKKVRTDIMLMQHPA